MAVATARAKKLTPPSWSPRHSLKRLKFDLDPLRAVAETREIIGWWMESLRWPEQPLFSGGVLDSWPAWAVDAFPILDAERRAVHALEEYEEERNA